MRIGAMTRAKTTGLAAISVFCLGLAAISLPALAGTNFDGVYDVTVTTTVGSCAKVQKGTVVIEGGHVKTTSEEGATAFGLVDTEGTISMQFHDKDELAHVAGYAKNGKKGPSATGTWSAPVSQCGGHWSAVRQG
jgi:hypothetical protein